MTEKKANLFIILGLLGIIVLIPLLKAKPPEAEGDIIGTEFKKIE